MTSISAVVSGKPGVAAVSRPRGFSLLELLVALTVIVLVTSLVSISFDSGGQDVRLEAAVRNLANVASYALDEAQMTERNYGLLLEEEYEAGELRYSYSWLEYQEERWEVPASGKELFARQQLPPGIALELELEDAPVVELSLEDDTEDDAEEVVTPQVVFYSSGEATVGAINVRRVEDSELLWRIEWDLLGRFDLLLRGEVEEED